MNDEVKKSDWTQTMVEVIDAMAKAAEEAPRAREALSKILEELLALSEQLEPYHTFDDKRLCGLSKALCPKGLDSADAREVLIAWLNHEASDSGALSQAFGEVLSSLTATLPTMVGMTMPRNLPKIQMPHSIDPGFDSFVPFSGDHDACRCGGIPSGEVSEASPEPDDHEIEVGQVWVRRANHYVVHTFDLAEILDVDDGEPEGVVIFTDARWGAEESIPSATVPISLFRSYYSFYCNTNPTKAEEEPSDG